MSVVLIETARPGVAVIGLNRPDVRNALTPEVARLIERAVDDIAEDDTTQVIVLTGSDTVFAVEAKLMFGTRDLHEGINSVLENRVPTVRGE